MEVANVIQEVNRLFQLAIPEKHTTQQLEEVLAFHINELINHDFEKLISILYRMDVHEEKLKYLLQQNSGENAASIIAKLIIEREEQKIKTRDLFSRENIISEEERW